MCAVPNMAVFWRSLTSCFPGMLLTYFRNDFEIVPVAPIITSITFVFTFHMRCISIVRSLYFRIFSASFLITFLSPKIATSLNIHVPFSLSRIIMSGLWLGIVLSVCIFWFHLASLNCFYWFWHMFIPVFFCLIVTLLLLLLLLLLLWCCCCFCCYVSQPLSPWHFSFSNKGGPNRSWFYFQSSQPPVLFVMSHV